MKRVVLLFALPLLLELIGRPAAATQEASWGQIKNRAASAVEAPAAKLTVSRHRAGGVNHSGQPILAFADQAQMGWSALKRYGDRIETEIQTEGIPAGHAVSVWWVVFNNPAGCATSPCGESDIFAAGNPALADVVGSRGQVMAADGTAHIQTYLMEGEPSTSALPYFYENLDLGAGQPIGLLDPINAEIHLVLRSHGPVIEGLQEEMLTTYEGGCTTNLDFGVMPQSQGECADLQFAVYVPPSTPAFADDGTVLSFAALAEMGSSKLVRYGRSVQAEIRTTGLVAGHALSLWWVVFNNPAGCATSPCGESDIFAAGNPALADVVGSRGQVMAADGTAHIQTYLMEGEPSTSALPYFYENLDLGAGQPIGLLDPINAEIHLVLRSHGPVIEGLQEEMLTTYEGGCTTNLDFGVVPQSQGECADLQFVIFQP